MNKNYSNVFFYGCIFIGLYVFILLISYFFQNKNSYIIQETFKDPLYSNQCNPFYHGKTFCQLNKNNNKCECKYQKDGINYPFKAPEPCCNNKCIKMTPSECQEKNPVEKTSYYCNIGGKCIKYQGTNKSTNISQNNCGLDPLNNQLLLPYSSLEECKSQNNPCDKYNKPNWSTAKKKSNCLKNVNCGFCTNQYDQGKCIEGTATGPNDILKYYYCNPGASKNNTYTYGDHALYII